MQSLKALSRSTEKNNILLKWNNVIAQSIMDMGDSSITLDDFFKNVLSTFDLAIGSTYKIYELISYFDKRKVTITSVRGVEYPGNITSVIKDYMDKSTPLSGKFMKSVLFEGDSVDIEKFDKILGYMNDEFKLSKARILPSFTQFNQHLSIKNKYTISLYGTLGEDTENEMPIISVEIS